MQASARLVPAPGASEPSQGVVLGSRLPAAGMAKAKVLHAAARQVRCAKRWPGERSPLFENANESQLFQGRVVATDRAPSSDG